jgi:cytochrome c-type biogenesis protein CcmH
MIGPRALSAKTSAISILAIFVVLILATAGCIREEDITLEQRAHQLAGELMCPVCDGQTIDGSDAQISQDMRLKIRELLDTGITNAEVRDYFVVRYGEEILAAPEGKGFNLIVWIMPFVIVFGGIGIAFMAVKNMRKAGLQRQLQPTRIREQDDLSDYLAQVDRDLATDANSAPTNPSTPEKETNS